VNSLHADTGPAMHATIGGDAEQFAQQLEQRFIRIERERMQDMPMLNPALQVRAVGFRRWQGHSLGILITPWFMNLVLCRMEPEPDSDSPARVGDSQRQAFPSGSYLFTAAIDEQLGSYQTCSLFSPMHEFADQQTAVEVAEAIIDALMDDGNQDSSGDSHSDEIQRRWHGGNTDEAEPGNPSDGDPAGEHDPQTSQPHPTTELVTKTSNDSLETQFEALITLTIFLDSPASLC